MSAPLPAARGAAALLFPLLASAMSAQGGAIDGDPHVEVHAAAAPEEVLHVQGGTPGGGPAAAALAGEPESAAAMEDLLPGGVAPEGDVPAAAAYTPDGARVLIAHRGTQSLAVFNAATHAHVASIPLSGSPNDVAVTADGLWAVTANIWEDTASIVDLQLLAETAVVPLGDQPAIVRAAPSGARVVVGNTTDQTLSVIDVASATETFRLPGAGFINVTAISFEPGQVTTSFAGLEFLTPTVVLHADFWNDQLELFNVALGTVTTLPCAADPRGVAVALGAGKAVVSHTGATRLLSVVDAATLSITKTIPTGIDLDHPIAIRPDGGKAVCAVLNAAVVVDLAAGTVSPPIDTASINDLLTTADGNYALCVGFQGSLISFASASEVKELNNALAAYAGARSPAGPKACLVASHNGEHLIFVDTSGALGFQEAVVPSGAPPEADKSRRGAITPDGTRAVTTDILSDTATIWDLSTGAVLAVVPVGDRPSGVAITPDGGTAVVANLDSSFVSVLDLASATAVSVPTSTRNSEVVISPDGHYAYVSVVLNDGVWRVDLGTLATSGPKLATGQMGSVSFLYQQSSGIALSHDGATLVTCDSFDDRITVIDTASWTVAASVPVGNNPVQAAFAPNDAAIYVTNKDAATVSVVTNAGATSAQVKVIAVGSTPYEVVASPDGARLFVGCTGTDAVDVIDLALGQKIASIPVPGDPQGLALSGGGACLRVASGSWSVLLGPKAKVAINQSGAFSTIDTAGLAVVDQVQTGEPGGGLAFDGCGSIGLIPAPLALDGVVRVRTGPPASAAPYGCGLNPPGSLTVLSGAPVLGSTLTLGLSNPLGTQPFGALPFLALAAAPDPAFPCGTPLPGFGMSAPGAAGELLLSLAPPPFAVLGGPAWTGPPAPIAIPVPAQCALLGAQVYAQGMIVDPTFALGSAFALTEGMELTLGR